MSEVQCMGATDMWPTCMSSIADHYSCDNRKSSRLSDRYVSCWERNTCGHLQVYLDGFRVGGVREPSSSAFEETANGNDGAFNKFNEMWKCVKQLLDTERVVELKRSIRTSAGTPVNLRSFLSLLSPPGKWQECAMDASFQIVSNSSVKIISPLDAKLIQSKCWQRRTKRHNNLWREGTSATEFRVRDPHENIPRSPLNFVCFILHVQI